METRRSKIEKIDESIDHLSESINKLLADENEVVGALRELGNLETKMMETDASEIKKEDWKHRISVIGLNFRWNRVDIKTALKYLERRVKSITVH